jgi:hypothetical protein
MVKDLQLQQKCPENKPWLDARIGREMNKTHDATARKKQKRRNTKI